MKKILYTLFTVSLLAMGCTQEIPVSRDHDINAEVIELETNMEMKTLYCNLNEAPALDLQKLGEYLTAQSVDVAMFVAPTEVAGENFKNWLEAYAKAQEKDGVPTLNLLTAQNNDGELIMAALVNAEIAAERYNIPQGRTLKNAVLHFKANGVHFVVTDMLVARNTMPSDWEDQVAEMTTNKKNVPLVYDPDVLSERKSELLYIIKQTCDNSEFIKDAHWMWAIDMNAESSLDITKYHRDFLRIDCYDAEDDFDWDAFYAKKTAYFTPLSEYIDATDPYFGLNDVMLYNNMIDCMAVYHSVYTPSSIDQTRRNFMYVSDKCWNLFHTFDLDTAIAADMGIAHYPIIVSLKREE